jgi:hypothetical protein
MSLDFLPSCRVAVLEDLLRVLDKGRKVGASALALGKLHRLFAAADDPRLRHLAFMVMMRLGGLAPTMFREEEDFGPAGGCCP